MLLPGDLDPLQCPRDVPPEGLAHASIRSVRSLRVEAGAEEDQEDQVLQYALHGIPNQQFTRAL